MESRWKIVDDALAAAFSGFEGKKLALFPGVQATETGKAAFPDDPKALAALISGHGASGLFESFDGGAPALYFASDAKAGLLPVKIRQAFAANRQNEGNKVYIRHGVEGELFPTLKMVFNGAHSHMRNWVDVKGKHLA